MPALGVLVTLQAVARSLVWRARLDRERYEHALVETERARMSREIHDTLLQSLVGTALRLDHLSDSLAPTQPETSLLLARIRRQVERHIDDAHQAIFDLRGQGGQGRSLPESLRDLCDEQDEGVPAVEFELVGPPMACTSQVRHQLLRIAGEAIANAKRHARAQRILVTLRYATDPQRVQVEVSDDGTGFDPGARATEASAHFGLTIMRERAEQIRAPLHIASTPGRGTTITVAAPVNAAPATPR
jgi:signal transduction histidine kinase